MFMTLLGYKRGFLRTFVGMMALIIAAAIAIIFGGNVSTWLDENTKLRQNTYETVYETFAVKAEANYAESDAEQKLVIAEVIPQCLLDAFEEQDGAQTTTVDEIADETADAQQSASQAQGIFAQAGTQLQSQAADFANGYIGRFANYTAENVLSISGRLLAFVGAFILLKLLQLLSKVVSHIPLLGLLNRILGAVLGFGRGLVIIWIIFYIVTLLSGTEFGMMALETIKGSQVLSLFYDGALSFGQIFV